jgi:hypothetical protein
MSWLEKITTDLIITMGDGRQFKPLWRNATKTKEYNISEFDFPNLAGTLVVRSEAKGRRYDLQLYFQGDNHLEQSEAFEKSADDKRPWKITHPYYGSITVQPVSLNFDNSIHNVTTITGAVIETITEDRPKVSIDPIDSIKNKKEDLDSIFLNSFDVKPTPTDINILSKSNQTVYKKALKNIKLTFDAEGYFNAFNTANTAILNATAEPLAAMRELQAVISYPVQFQESVRNRINLLVDQFNLLRESISGTIKRSEKKIYEISGGAVISSIAAASVTNFSYSNRKEVVGVVDTILKNYNQYIADLDLLQSPTGGTVDSFVPDWNASHQVKSLVNFTVSKLFEIGINSKQERIYFAEDDTNIILLVHKFYGLLQDDSTIEEFIKNNEIGFNELLEIRKGRKIIYYI